MPSYYVAATLARLADEMVAFTLVLLVLERTDSPALAGLTGAAYALPAVVTGPLLGAWLDRTPYRRSALALNQAVLGVVMLSLLGVVGHSAHWVTPVLAAVAGATLPMVSGGFTSMLPSLVPQERLARANSLEAASFGAATITGPATAATISAVFSVETAVLVIALAATLSIVAITRLPALPRAVTGGEPFMASVVGGLAHLARTPRLRASTVTTTLLLGVMGILLITLPLHMESLGMPTSAAGYLWTALEVGCVTTALAVRPTADALASGVRGDGVRCGVRAGHADVAAGRVLRRTPAAGGCRRAAARADMPAMFAARQQYSPQSLQGRVSTTAASLRVGTAALGQVRAASCYRRSAPIRPCSSSPYPGRRRGLG